MRDYHTLADLRVSTLSIECEPCGRRGRYSVARLMEQYGDAKLPERVISSPIARRRSRPVQGALRRGQPREHAGDLERMIRADLVTARALEARGR